MSNPFSRGLTRANGFGNHEYRIARQSLRRATISLRKVDRELLEVAAKRGIVGSCVLERLKKVAHPVGTISLQRPEVGKGIRHDQE